MTLNVHLQPGAKASAIAGLHGDAVKIRIAAPAVDNKANRALCLFLGELLEIPSSAVTIISGPRSRRKRVSAEGVGAQAMTRFRAALAASMNPD